MAPRDTSNRTAVTIASVMLGVASIGASAALLATGIRPGPVPVAEPEPAPAPVVAQKVSGSAPAAITVPQSLLESPGEGLVPDGSVSAAAPTPWPMSCGKDPLVPLASLSRTIKGSYALQVTVQSFAPGAGAAAFKAQSESVDSCQGDTWVGRIQGNSVSGTEQVSWSGSRSAASIRGNSFRTGDVIVHVSGTGHLSAASAMDKSLDALMEKVCHNPDSTAAGWERNPLSPSPAPFRIPETVTVQDPGLPEVPQGAEHQATPIPAELTALTEATPMQAPDWPVWPMMPSPVERPTEPQAPAQRPTLEGTFQALARDSYGPGCGWSWTGQSPSVFDEATAQQANQREHDRLHEELTGGVQDWQRQVNLYWEQVARHQDQAEAWNRYAAEVLEVNAAWEAINAQWADYQDRYTQWQTREKDRADLISRQRQAEEEWLQELRQCEDLNARRQAESDAQPSPSPEPSPTEAEDAEPEPEQTEQPEPFEPVDCMSESPRPGVLDVEVPQSEPAPAKPEDPRPAEQRAGA